MKLALLPESGSFYKANLHTHSIHSDGGRTVEDIKADYMAHGYSIVAFTDHDIMIDHSDLNEPEKFLALTSLEMETNEHHGESGYLQKRTYHLNLYAGKPNETYYPCANPSYCWKNATDYVQDYYRGDYVRRYSVEGQNEIIRDAKEHGFLVCYNHPQWSLQRYPDYAGLEGLTGVEVYNTGSARIGYLLDASEHVLDDFLDLGTRVYPIAADDSHGTGDCFGGWVQFRAEALTYDHIMQAFAKGDLYASWGPEIRSLCIEDGILHMDCANTAKVALSADLRSAYRYAEFDPSAPAHFTCDLRDWLAKSRERNNEARAYFRLTLVDGQGNKALTRGYFADELAAVAL